MKETWDHRLRAAMKSKGWNATILAARSGVDRDSIYKYLKGMTPNPTGDRVEKLANALNVRYEWLRVGTGERDETQFIKATGVVVPILDLQQSLTIIDVPGDIIMASKQSVAVPVEHGDRTIGFRLDDSSMADKFPAGSIVLCDPDAPLEPDCYVVVTITKLDKALVRRYRVASAGPPETWELHPENRAYSVEKFRPGKDGRVIGRAIYAMVSL